MLKFWIVALFCIGISIHIQAQSEPTISTCDGNQTICLTGSTYDMCVQIEVKPGLPAPIDHFEIEWGDGSAIMTIPGSETPAPANHIFNFENFFQTCTEQERSTIVLETFLENGDVVNNAFVATFKNPPTARFSPAQSTICIGEEARFNDDSCPTQGLEIVSWDYGDGTSGTENTHIYNALGTYQVELTVRNGCATTTTTRTLEVIEEAVATGLPLMGVSSIQNDTFVVCLGDGNEVMLDGDSLSINELTYDWRVLSSGTTWLTEDDISDPTLRFNNAGIFRVELLVNNNCDQPSRDTMIFNVVDAAGFSLNKQPDECISIAYTPEPFLSEVTYAINGNITTSFPVDLPVGEYFVEATHPNNLCGENIKRDTFTVSAPEMAQITSADTTLCSISGPISIVATEIPGAQWLVDGQAFDGTLDPATLTGGIHIITYGLAPCIAIDSMQLEVLDAAITFSGPDQLCLDAPPQQLTASPAGGRWRGTAVTPDGLFDPMSAGEGTHTVYYDFNHPLDSVCNNTDSLQILVSNLFVDFTTLDCEGTSLSFDTIQTSDFTTITWDFGDGSTSNQLSPTHTFPAPQSYDVRVRINASGCEAETTRTITISGPPNPQFALDYNGDCSPLSVSIANSSTGDNLRYEWDFGNGTVSDLADPGPVVLEALGRDTVYQIQLTLSNDCATEVMTQSVPVKAQALANFGTNFNSYCSGDTILLSNNSLGSPTFYEWQLNGQTMGSDSLPPKLVHYTDTEETIELCQIVENTCGRDTLCRNILIRPTDVSSFFNVDRTEVCTGDSLQFTNFSNTSTVRYFFGDGNSTTTVNPAYAFNTPGNFRVALQAYGCGSDSSFADIEVRPAPTAAFVAPDRVCPGQQFGVENTSDATDFQWFVNDTLTSGLAIPSFQLDTPGIYRILLTAGNLSGCIRNAFQEVEVVPAPEVEIMMDADSICAGDVLQLSSMTSGVGCVWDFGNGSGSSDCSPEVVFTSSGLTTVKLLVNSDLACRDSALASIFIRPVPVTAFDFGPTPLCVPATVNFENNSTDAETFVWDFGDGTVSDAGNPTHIFTLPGDYPVKLVATRDGICSTELESVLTVYPLPQADYEINDSTICQGTITELRISTPASSIRYQWDFGDGTSAFSPTVDHLYSEPGTYPLRLSLLDEVSGCTDTLQREISVYEVPELTGLSADNPCFSDTIGRIDLTATAGFPPYQFQWNDGSSSEDRSELATGTYSVTVIDGNGCEEVASFAVEAPQELVPQVITDIPATCAGDTDGYLEIQVSGGQEPYRLNWDNGQDNPALTGVPAGDYALTITDALGCESIQTYLLRENPPLTASDTVFPIRCFGDYAAIVLEPEGGIGPYEALLTPDMVALSGSNFRFDSLTGGAYQLVLTDSLGCSLEVTYDIRIPSPVEVSILPQAQEVQLGDSLYLTIVHNVANPVIHWDPSTPELDTSFPESPLLKPQDDRTYTVSVSNENGCSAFDEVSIRVIKGREVFIPNAFSPNGDSHNDEFRIFACKGVSNIQQVQIFNRWGNMVFEQQNIPPICEVGAKLWDGRLNNRKVNSGVFVYKVTVEYIDGLVETYYGDVTLVR